MSTEPIESNVQTSRLSILSKRFLIYAGVVVIAFLLGLVPMWWKSRTCANELDTTQKALLISSIQNAIANAAIDARRGEYEPARQAASEFFTKLHTEVERRNDSVFAQGQKTNLDAIFSQRDDTVTLLARSDPASADRLMDLYQKYRQVAAGSKP